MSLVVQFFGTQCIAIRCLRTLADPVICLGGHSPSPEKGVVSAAGLYPTLSVRWSGGAPLAPSAGSGGHRRPDNLVVLELTGSISWHMKESFLGVMTAFSFRGGGGVAGLPVST